MRVVHLKPFLVLFKLLGLFACSVRNGQLVRDTILGPGLCCAWILLLISRSIYIVYQIFVISNSGSMVFMIHTFIEVFLNCLTIAPAFKQQLYIDFFRKLQEYDENVASLGYQRKDAHRQFQMALILVTIFFIIHFICYFVQVYSLDWKEALYEFMMNESVGVLLLLSSFNVLKIYLQQDLLLQRFRHLNIILLPHTSWTKTSDLKELTGMNVIKDLHIILFHAYEALNEIYSWTFVYISSQAIFGGLVSAYIEVERGKSIYNLSIWVTLVQLLTICACCHLMTNEAINTGKIITRDKSALVNSGNTKERIEMLIHLLHNEVFFSGASCFDVNLQLYCNIVTLLITYVCLNDRPF